MEMNELELHITKDKEFQSQKQDQVSPTQNKERISTGITKLDEMLSGGYPKGRVILVSGTPGSGKTIFCFHYISAGIQQGEKCLYLSTDEHVDSLLQEAEEFGFHFQNAINQQQAKFIYLTIDRNDIHQQIEGVERYEYFVQLCQWSLRIRVALLYVNVTKHNAYFGEVLEGNNRPVGMYRGLDVLVDFCNKLMDDLLTKEVGSPYTGQRKQHQKHKGVKNTFLKSFQCRES